MSNIEIFEDQRAAGYDQFVETWIPNYRYFMSKVPRLLRESRDQPLLVAGCGTGTEIEFLLHEHSSWNITGVDPSPDMIQQARTRLQAFKSIQLIEGVVKDLEATPSFGAATLLLVLHFMPDDGTKLALLKDIADRMQKNAPFVLLDITGHPEQLRANLQILKQLLPDHVEAAEIENRLYRIEHKLHPVSEERLGELLVEAGFRLPLRFFQTAIYMGWLCYRS
ncbi:MAG: methyltransferase [Bacteroidota bacterium]